MGWLIVSLGNLLVRTECLVTPENGTEFLIPSLHCGLAQFVAACVGMPLIVRCKLR